MPVLRALHVINGEHYAGAERVQDLLALRLPEFGVQVGFACLKPDRFPAMRASVETPLLELAMTSRFDLQVCRRLIDHVRQHDYQILHAHTPRTCLIASYVSLRTGLPLVYHVHSPTSRDSTRRWANLLNAWTERLSLMRANQLICVSSSLGQHMHGLGYREDQITVVPNGVAVRKSIANRPPPTGRWIIGMVALFRPRKGIEILLHSLAQLRDRGHDVSLRAVGPFETETYQRDIHTLVAKLGLGERIQWTGFTKEVNEEFDQMHIMALPSLFGEGLPMVVLEAMAAGVPVAGTKVEGVPEVIRDGLDGVLSEPGDPADLTRALTQILDGQLDWTTLRRNAISRQQQQFSDRSMAAGVARAYRQLLART